MILVNTPGSWEAVYAPLAHATWHGFTPTDLVFPFFLFVMGTTMAQVLPRKITQPKWQWQIFKRSMALFLVGIGLNIFPFVVQDWNWSSIRIMGVLQRIALCYLLCTPFCLVRRTWRLGFCTATLLLYWTCLIVFGGEQPYDQAHNAVRQLDLLVLGSDHLWMGRGIPFDPEGLLSTWPAMVTVLLGYESDSLRKTPQKLALAGCFLAILGLLWHPWFPINKQLWTSSYVLLSAGLGCLVLAFLEWTESRGLRAVFTPFGQNPLFLYVVSIMWIKILLKTSYVLEGQPINGYAYLFETVFEPLCAPQLASLVFALTHVAVFWLMARYMSRNALFVRL